MRHSGDGPHPTPASSTPTPPSADRPGRRRHRWPRPPCRRDGSGWPARGVRRTGGGGTSVRRASVSGLAVRPGRVAACAGGAVGVDRSGCRLTASAVASPGRRRLEPTPALGARGAAQPPAVDPVGRMLTRGPSVALERRRTVPGRRDVDAEMPEGVMGRGLRGRGEHACCRETGRPQQDGPAHDPDHRGPAPTPARPPIAFDGREVPRHDRPLDRDRSETAQTRLDVADDRHHGWGGVAERVHRSYSARGRRQGTERT